MRLGARNEIPNGGGDTSIVDDFVASGYCKYESRLVLRSTEILPVFFLMCTIYILMVVVVGITSTTVCSHIYILYMYINVGFGFKSFAYGFRIICI